MLSKVKTQLVPQKSVQEICVTGNSNVDSETGKGDKETGSSFIGLSYRPEIPMTICTFSGSSSSMVTVAILCDKNSSNRKREKVDDSGSIKAIFSLNVKDSHW